VASGGLFAVFYTLKTLITSSIECTLHLKIFKEFHEQSLMSLTMSGTRDQNTNHVRVEVNLRMAKTIEPRRRLSRTCMLA
jgi:hypothetical protein